MNKLITTNTGGKHLTQDDFGFMQNFTAEALKYLLTGLGLGSQAFILFGCNLTPVQGGLTVSSGAMFFAGEAVPVSEQTVSGTGEIEKYWFVLQRQTGHVRTYFNGQLLPTQEYLSVGLVFSEAQPAGGVPVASVVAWSKRFYDVMVAEHIPTKLSQLSERSYNSLTELPTIPTTLPASGGDADTLDGKHANEFVSAEDSGWTDLAPGSSMSSTNTKYRKLNGVVYVNINASCSSDMATVGILPEGFRPSVPLGTLLITQRQSASTTAYGWVEILTSGHIRVTAAQQYTPFNIATSISFPI